MKQYASFRSTNRSVWHVFNNINIVITVIAIIYTTNNGIELNDNWNIRREKWKMAARIKALYGVSFFDYEKAY